VYYGFPARDADAVEESESRVEEGDYFVFGYSRHGEEVEDEFRFGAVGAPKVASWDDEIGAYFSGVVAETEPLDPYDGEALAHHPLSTA